MADQFDTEPDSVVLALAGWQVWDGQYWPVRVGDDLVASVEFVEQSSLELAPPMTSLKLHHIDANIYRATAQVLDATDAVVLDLGAFRAVSWIRPGEDSRGFSEGATVSLDLRLDLNGWPRADWTVRAAERFGINHRWRVDRIVRQTVGLDDATDIAEARIDNVESGTDNQYCLLYCSRASTSGTDTG